MELNDAPGYLLNHLPTVIQTCCSHVRRVGITRTQPFIFVQREVYR